jgi:hypothetical protein
VILVEIDRVACWFLRVCSRSVDLICEAGEGRFQAEIRPEFALAVLGLEHSMKLPSYSNGLTSE